MWSGLAKIFGFGGGKEASPYERDGGAPEDTKTPTALLESSGASPQSIDLATVRANYVTLFDETQVGEDTTVAQVREFLERMQGTDTQLLSILENLLRTLYPQAYKTIQAARTLIDKTNQRITNIEKDIETAEFDEDKAALETIKAQHEVRIQKVLHSILEILLNLSALDLIHEKVLDLQKEMDQAKKQAHKRLESRQKVLAHAREATELDKEAIRIAAFAKHAIPAIVGAVAPEVVELVEQIIETRRDSLQLAEVLHSKSLELDGNWNIGHSLEEHAAGEAEITILGEQVVETLKSIGNPDAVDEVAGLLTGETIEEVEVIKLIDAAHKKMRPYLVEGSATPVLPSPTDTTRASAKQTSDAQGLDEEITTIHSAMGNKRTQTGEQQILQALKKTPHTTKGLGTERLNWLIEHYTSREILMIVAAHPNTTTDTDTLLKCIKKAVELKFESVVTTVFNNPNNKPLKSEIQNVILEQKTLWWLHGIEEGSMLKEIFFSDNATLKFQEKILKNIAKFNKDYDAIFYTLAIAYIKTMQDKASTEISDTAKAIMAKLFSIEIDKVYDYKPTYPLAQVLADLTLKCYFAGPEIGKKILAKSSKKELTQRTALLLRNPHCTPRFRESFLETEERAYLKALVHNPSTESHILNNILRKLSVREQLITIEHPNMSKFGLKVLIDNGKNTHVKNAAHLKLQALAA